MCQMPFPPARRVEKLRIIFAFWCPDEKELKWKMKKNPLPV
jgi:hypothetical protein